MSPRAAKTKRLSLAWRLLLLALFAALPPAAAFASVPSRTDLAVSNLSASLAHAGGLASLAPREEPDFRLFAGFSLLPKTRVRGFEVPVAPRVGVESELTPRARPGWDEPCRETASGLRLGLELDPDLNWYYARNRWYDPETGSFASADPLGYPDSANAYVWGVAGPWAQDPLGLEDPEEKGWINKALEWAADTRPARDLGRAARWTGRQFGRASDSIGKLLGIETKRALASHSAVDPNAEELRQTELEGARGSYGGVQPGRALNEGLAETGEEIAETGGRELTREALYWGAGAGVRKVVGALPVGVSRIRGVPLVRSSLPPLTGRVKGAFGHYTLRTYKAGERVYRSPHVPHEKSAHPTEWFGTRETATRAGTESQSNIVKWTNPVSDLRTYEFRYDVTVYHGDVAGGKGYQILIPSDIEPGSVLRFIEEKKLK